MLTWRRMGMVVALVALAGATRMQEAAMLDPAQAGPDFAIQGEYTGEVAQPDGGRTKVGVQVIARGDGKFDSVLYLGGLPGDGWDRNRHPAIAGERREGVVKLALNAGQWVATINEGVMTIADRGGQTLGALRRVVRRSPTLGQVPPPGAIVLFDGNTNDFEPGRLSEDGLLVQGQVSRRRSQSCRLHLEFLLSFMPSARGQGRSNSGVYLQSRYEVQILDSFGEREEMGNCGGIYSVRAPGQNLCFPPLSWQTYDVDFTAARYDAQGNKISNARLTVWHNGVLVHKNVEVDHATTGAPLPEGPEPGPLFLQDHGNPVRFRNIWMVEKGDEAAMAQKVSVLLIGGQNNHNWQASTPFLQQLLQKAPHFEVTVRNAPGRGASPQEWEGWQPRFQEFDVVVLDYNGEMWPERVRKEFEEYVLGGGGVVVIHAANNAFTGWKQYERMVGLLWRAPDYGASLYVTDNGQVVREEAGQGRGMGHGSQYDWLMVVRDPQHPITRGMPEQWLHKHDELYHGQRGPAEQVHILLTAYSDPAPGRGGTGKHEPIVWWVPYGEGKVVTNLMGHVGELDALQCVGFKTILYRACEWLATGECWTPIPANFPTAEVTSVEE